MQVDTYRLNHLYPKIKNSVPLSEKEIVEVVSKLPSHLAEKYIGFTLWQMDLNKLRSLVAARPAAAEEDIEPLEYAGLKISGTDVSYLGAPIKLAYKERQVLRTFMEHPGELLPPDRFLNDPEIVDANREYRSPRAHISKLISVVRIKLVEQIKQPCILNENKEGWKLIIT